jgi:hypothetical protein
VPLAFESTRGRQGGERLAQILERGPLSLEPALRHATDIASALRELHQDGRAHGSVDPSHIIIRSSEASLLTADRRGYPDPLDDLSGFGGTLYAMLTGRTAAGEEMRLVASKPAVLNGPSAVRAAAMRLAERCLTAERETAPDFQKILTEVRLLHVMAKQFSPETAGIQIAPPPPPPPPPSPVLMSPPQPLEVFAGTAPPVINPPAVRPTTPFPAPPQAPEPAGAEATVEIDPPAVTPSEPAAQPPAGSTARPSGRTHSRPILKDVVCPKCKDSHVRLSRPRTRFERFLNLLGIGVHRCHRCYYRYIPLLGRKIVRKSQ